MPVNLNQAPRFIIAKAPPLIALAVLLLGGIFLLNRADVQARDTIRKHHLDDLETSLYLAHDLHGTYPPYNQPTWCGLLNDPTNSSVRAPIEEALRQRIDKYANNTKPFPTDPLASELPDYFYWKRTPTLFELDSILEIDRNGLYGTSGCPNAPLFYYDYNLNSGLRGNNTQQL
ncbi:MAG: hypothetical protein U1C49_00725 [Candidatus Andersenbacteria bacterium]|nr:hypothetical protein [bacterium]MDZ4225350.1 hypothetical protein [Candidatus Andersenbacteria bacterium]